MTCVCHLHCNRKYINEQIIIRYNRCVEIMLDTGIYPNADHWSTSALSEYRIHSQNDVLGA